MASFKMPFSFWIDSVADCIAEMMIEEAVKEMKAEPVMTSLAELINNLPEDCSQMIYKKVMSDCIQSITHQVKTFYDVKIHEYFERTCTLENKIDGLRKRYKKCKNKKASDDKEEAYKKEIKIFNAKRTILIDRRLTCPPVSVRECILESYRD